MRRCRTLQKRSPNSIRYPSVFRHKLPSGKSIEMPHFLCGGLLSFRRLVMYSVYAVLSYGLAQCSTAAATHRIALPFSLASRCSMFPQFSGESAAWRSVVRRQSNCISGSSKFRAAPASFNAWKAWKTCGQSLSALSVGPLVWAWMDYNLPTLSVRADRTSPSLCHPRLAECAQGVGDQLGFDRM